MKKQERIEGKEIKELERRRRQLNKTKAFALPVVLLLIVLAAFVDEIATASTGQIQSSVVNEFFVIPQGVTYNEGVAMFSGMLSVTSLFYFLCPFYKALADKFGRKIFLALNVAGMGIGMLLCWWSPNVGIYVLGAAMISFFIQHDMQIIYLYEVVPADKRATIYGVLKGLANLSIIAVPVLRRVAMQDNAALWRNIFAVPVIGCAIITVCIALGMRESGTFLRQRIAWLEKPYEERHPKKEPGKKKEKQANQHKTGVFVGMKHLFREKQLFSILMVACSFAMVSPCIFQYVESIMHDYGMDTVSITDALMLYPVIYALIMPVAGYLGDKLGRKKIVVGGGIMTIVGFAAFNVSAMLGLHPYVVGVFYGVYLGCWWTTVDFTNMMSSESVPTYNRGSVAGAGNLIALVSGFLGFALTIVAPLLFPRIGFGYMTVAIPFVLLGVIIMALRVKETKGVDMDSIEYQNI